MPGRIHYDDLSKEDRRTLAGRIDKTKRARGSVRQSDRSDRSQRDDYRAHCVCGEVFTSEAAANRHCQVGPGHRRYVWDGLE